MDHVYILQHCYEQWGSEDTKLVGVYTSRREAEAAVRRLRVQPGFRDWPGGFSIDKYEVDEDNWSEGFVKLVPIHIEVQEAGGPRLICVQATWRPGDRYEIVENGESHEGWAFAPGDIVRCELRTVDDNDECLVAVARAGDAA